MSLDNYVIEAARVMKRLREAVKLFNTIKSHSYYQEFKVFRVVAKRTGVPNLNVVVADIPQTKNQDQPERLVIVIYISREKKVQRIHFVSRLEYIMRLLKKFMHSDGGVWWHVNIYFIGEVFRAGVYEEARYSRALFKSKGLDIRLKLIELRYGNEDLVNSVFNDLLEWLGTRVCRLISKGKYSRSKGKVFGRLKHLLDYIIAILMSLKEGDTGLSRIEDLMRKHEEDVDTYLDLLRELGYVGARTTKKLVTEARSQPQTYLPTIRYTKQNLSEGSGKGIEGEEEGYEVVEEEVVKDDFEKV